MENYIVGNKYVLNIEKDNKSIAKKKYTFTEFIDLDELFGGESHDEVKCALLFESGDEITDALVAYVLKDGSIKIYGMDPVLSNMKSGTISSFTPSL